MIPQETVAKILDLTKIEDVLGEYVSLKRKGANLWACCPFHNEKTPSFSVSPAKGFYKCFGCGKSGSAVGFLMDHEGMSYVEAIKHLGKKYGVEVIDKEESAEEIMAGQRKESLILVSEFAEQFFTANLDTEEGKILARAYYASRGIEEETIRRFGLGWAPSKASKSLTETALEAGYKEEYLLATGLTMKSEDGRLYDRFRERVMFPIHDVRGRVIAYSGRTLRSDKEVAKYMNSPESEIYVKSNSLFGIYLAKSEISRLDKCLLVEGNVDVVSMHQLGIRNVVASCGTSLTIEQIRLIKRFTENITIMYDGDGAGIHAAERGIGMILKERMNVRVVFLPEGQDPDDFARRHTLEEVREFISENEQDFISFKADRLMNEAAGDPIKKAGLITDIADTIALVDDPIQRTVYVQNCSTKFSVSEEILLRRIAATRKKNLEDARKESGPVSVPGADYVPAAAEESVTATAAAPRGPVGSADRALDSAERGLLFYVLRYGRELLRFDQYHPFYRPEGPQTVLDFIDSVLVADEMTFCNELYQRTYDKYIELFDSQPVIDQETIIRRLIDGEDREVAGLVSDLAIEKHELSVVKFQSSLTALSTQLIKFVPESLLVYQKAKVEKDIADLTASLRSEPERTDEILRELVELNKIKRDLGEDLLKMNS